MSTRCHYRQLAIDRMSHQYKVEKQCLLYLKVLLHKVHNPNLRQLIALSMTDARLRMKTLRGLLSSMNTPSRAGSTAGASGILKEGFQRLEQEPVAALRDTVIAQTLVLLHQYRVGNYRIIITYFRALNWVYEAHQLQGLLTNAQATCSQLTELLTSVPIDTSAQAPPDSSNPRCITSSQTVDDGLLNPIN